MASFVIDSDMFKDQYGTPEMRAVFSDEQLMQNWLNAWVALAEAETELGIVPKEAGEQGFLCNVASADAPDTRI